MYLLLVDIYDNQLRTTYCSKRSGWSSALSLWLSKAYILDVWVKSPQGYPSHSETSQKDTEDSTYSCTRD